MFNVCHKFSVTAIDLKLSDISTPCPSPLQGELNNDHLVTNNDNEWLV